MRLPSQLSHSAPPPAPAFPCLSLPLPLPLPVPLSLSIPCLAFTITSKTKPLWGPMSSQWHPCRREWHSYCAVHAGAGCRFNCSVMERRHRRAPPVAWRCLSHLTSSHISPARHLTSSPSHQPTISPVHHLTSSLISPSPHVFDDSCTLWSPQGGAIQGPCSPRAAVGSLRLPGGQRPAPMHAVSSTWRWGQLCPWVSHAM